AMVVVQEIFGVNSHIRAVADGYAADGYLAVAPALFERASPGYETGYSAEEIAASRELMSKVSMDDALKDVAASIEYAKSGGKVGIVGYCWGGTVAWLSATRLAGLACAVPYYGGQMGKFIDETPRCPVTGHFGEQDTMPAPDQIRALVAAHPSVTAHFYEAGHGFNCDQRGSYNAQASALARSRTLAFLAEQIG
ncbi:MAG: dienelactone hydrolase family protein, partial [Quisquiliibacterium sp.]